MKVLSGKDIPQGLLESLESEQPCLINREEDGSVVLLSVEDLPPESRRHLLLALSEYVRFKVEEAGETPESLVAEFYRARKAGG